MAAWPPSLPPMLIQGYSATHNPLVLETEMESGPKRRTRMSEHFITNGVGSMILNKSQMYALGEALSLAKDGADWMTGAPIDVGGGPLPHRIRVTGYQINVVTPGITWRAIIWWETDERKLV